MRPFLLSAFALLLLAGCASQRPFSDYRTTVSEQGILIDSLRQENRHLRARYAAILDTLSFYDDIDSGRFYRRVGSLNSQINRLEYDLSVSRDGGLTVTTLLADELFEPASATFTAQGAERLAEVATLLQDRHAGTRVRIEGHSDSVPVGPGLQEKYPSNWELSLARATTVARHLMTELGVDENRFEIAGYGSVLPVASNATTEGRRQNRRIRVAVQPPSPDDVAATQ